MEIRVGREDQGRKSILSVTQANCADKRQQNIAKAQAEIDRLETEAQPTSDKGTHDSAKKPSLANSGVNGEASADAELAQEEDAAKDVAVEMEKAKIEDAQEV